MFYVGAMVGFVIANFGYQAFGAHNWLLAIDRSWFQVCAIAVVWIGTALKNRNAQTSC